MCKDPEMGSCLVCLRANKDLSVTQVEKAREK